jgi:hypothetical protein
MMPLDLGKEGHDVQSPLFISIPLTDN